MYSMNILAFWHKDETLTLQGKEGIISAILRGLSETPCPPGGCRVFLVCERSF